MAGVKKFPYIKDPIKDVAVIIVKALNSVGILDFELRRNLIRIKVNHK